MNYKEAMKKPKGGFTCANAEQTLTYGCEILAERHGLCPEAVFEWAKKHKVDVVKFGPKLARLDNNLLLAVLNDRLPEL